MKNMQDMTSGHPLKLIVKFSIPLLIGNIFQQLYSISDIIIVGRLIGIKALAAVGVSAPLFFMLVLVSIGFTNGLTVITAQRFGARDYRGLRRSVTTATLLSSAFTLSAGAVMLASLDVLFKVMNVPQEIAQDAKSFISIISYGVIMIVFFNLLSGFMRALGDSKTPLYFLIFTTLLNITFNIVFIYCMKLGVAGSALGTVCAMTVSVFCCLLYIGKKYPILHPQKEDWKLNWQFCKQHLKIAVPMAVQFSIIAVSATITQSVCNSFGPDTIAAFLRLFDDSLNRRVFGTGIACRRKRKRFLFRFHHPAGRRNIIVLGRKRENLNGKTANRQQHQTGNRKIFAGNDAKTRRGQSVHSRILFHKPPAEVCHNRPDYTSVKCLWPQKRHRSAKKS